MREMKEMFVDQFDLYKKNRHRQKRSSTFQTYQRDVYSLLSVYVRACIAVFPLISVYVD